VEKSKIDYFSICTPNYLHFDHIRCSLRNGANAVCEKPLVLSINEIDLLQDLELKTGKSVFNILQLRVHPSILELKKRIDSEKPKEKYKINLTYITSRGPWYFETWKADLKKSGGLATNIGIHFFDMLAWIFGKPEKNEIYLKDEKTNSGYLELEKARISWCLSIDRNLLPKKAIEKKMGTYRSITIDGSEFEFSDGFTELHTRVYEQIITKNSFGLNEARTAVQIAEEIRSKNPSTTKRNLPYELLQT
jgi:UDP-N-acetyl-2-amino-2-deoxyglucuronate dehydrogenase